MSTFHMIHPSFSEWMHHFHFPFSDTRHLECWCRLLFFVRRNVSCLGIIVDALFGFSFKPPVRPEFQPLMEILTKGFSSSVPVVAVDIPSGWDVENGPVENDPSIYFMPDTLISLTAPKACAKYFKGRSHYVGGRFVPDKLAQKYSLILPEYPGTEVAVKI